MRRVDEDEIDELLVRHGIGVLALVEDGRPYAIPMSFGYDAEKPVFPMQWCGGDDSRKRRAAKSNPKACLTVYEQDAEQTAIWRSIVIEGELTEIQADQREHAFACLAANAEFAQDFGIWGTPFEDVEFRLFGLEVANCSGQEFGQASTDESNP